jgi:hypothetical protein
MKRTLYDIGDDIRALMDLMDEQGPELAPEVDAALSIWFAELESDEARKLDGCTGMIRQWEMEAAACRAEADQWSMKARHREGNISRMKDRLKGYIEASGRKKVETASGRVLAVQANGGKVPVILAEPLDPAILPDHLAITRRIPDTDAIRAALESGEPLAFAHLAARGSHLRVR